MADVQLQDGSIERTDPTTGKKRIISAADYQRTRLTRERDAELSMQAGAPPIAKGPTANAQPSSGASQSSDRYRTDNRDLNVARAKADGQFDSKRATYNANNTATQMDTAGTITPRLPDAAATAAAVSPAAMGPTGRVRGTNEGLPPEPKVGDPLPTATQAQAMQPQLPPPESLQNMQMAAGPNISANDPLNPNTLPAGSIGYARKDGTYSVKTADGKPQSFANEAAAKAQFAKIAARPQAAQAAEAFLAKNAAAQPAQPPAAPVPVLPAPAAALAAAPAPGTAGPTGTVRTANQGLPATAPAPTPVSYVGPAPAAPAPTPVSFVGPAPTAPATMPAPSFAQMQAEAVPVAPALAAVMQAATAAPTPAPTPVTPVLPRPGQNVEGGALKRDLARASAALDRITGSPDRQAADRARSQERSSAEESKQMKRKIKSPGFQRDLESGIDERPVTPRLPERAFGDEDPAAFPTLPGAAGTSRPRAILA